MHSTGKYSTKQTAKKRYLPRVRKGVKQFVELEKALDKPEAVQAFNQFVDDNLGSALSLFGASTRVGELPDKGSRTVEAEVEDFVRLCKALGKVAECGCVGTGSICMHDVCLLYLCMVSACVYIYTHTHRPRTPPRPRPRTGRRRRP